MKLALLIPTTIVLGVATRFSSDWTAYLDATALIAVIYVVLYDVLNDHASAV